MICLSLIFCWHPHVPVPEPYLSFFVGDDHGGEAMVDRSDANWAHGNSAVTSSWLLLVVRAVGAFVANQIALVLGRTMQQLGG